MKKYKQINISPELHSKIKYLSALKYTSITDLTEEAYSLLINTLPKAEQQFIKKVGEHQRKSGGM